MINIANDFSKYPAGRYLNSGPFSGERFRVEHLVPSLKPGVPVTIDLDGVLGYGSSFLEEAFGGLVRQEGFVVPDLLSKLYFKASDKNLITEIQGYIKNARR